jgi:hypothetical protein
MSGMTASTLSIRMSAEFSANVLPAIVGAIRLTIRIPDSACSIVE